MSEPVKLTVDRCKEICRDFRLESKPRTDGKRGCLHVMPDREMCNLPSHFRCELVRWKENQARRELLKGSALSPSRIGTLEQCPRAYHLHYNEGIAPESPPPWKRMGDAWGVARARLDKKLEVDPTMLRDDLLPYEAAKVRASIRLYRLVTGLDHRIGYGPGEVDCEVEVFFEHGGQWWLGYIDSLSKNRARIWEWKYAVTEYDLLSIARQAAVYFKGVPEAQDFSLCVFRKPNQRPGKEENELAFENRIAIEMSRNPHDWIKTFTFTRDQLNVDGILRDMASSFKHELAAAEASGWVPHYSSCRDCDYRSICADHVGMPTETIVQIRKKAT